MKMNKTTKVILEVTNIEAEEFFLQDSSYCSIDLPKYFVWNKLLAKIDEKFPDNIKNTFKEDGDPKKLEGVNYKIFSNKDGLYDWRPIEIIHPVLYVGLVRLLTENENWKAIKKRFEELKQINITCMSIPVYTTKSKKQKAEQIHFWWDCFEQESIKQNLEYSYLLKSDISNCYGSIYTHSIAWALH
jgi:hypothetical protein